MSAHDLAARNELRQSRERRPFPRALVTAARPRQWTKNLLVFAAPAAAGALGHAASVGRAAAAGGIFILVSSGTYLINDANDVLSDRAHPVKQHRPIAAGDIHPRVAWVIGLAFVAIGLVAAIVLGGAALGWCIGAYIALTTAYSTGVKRVPFVELAFVASGFVLRAVAGGVAVGVSISPWFLLVTSTCALLIVAGKRTAELLSLGPASVQHRAVVAYYRIVPLAVLRIAMSVVAAAGYGLWAFSQAARVDARHASGDDIFFRLSIIPFVAGLVILERALRRGEGGEPEELALHNRALQVAGAVCVGLVLAGVYL